VKIKLKELRRIIRDALVNEVGANGSWPGQPVMRNALSPDINSREAIGKMTAKNLDTDEEGVPEHLREPQVTPEECYGPVPPDSEPVSVHADPFTRDYSPNPTGNIKR